MFQTLLTILFIVLSLFLIGIVLVQEGKGGGLGGAFGGAGGDAFGHGVGGINKFTGVVAGIWMLLAIVLANMNNITGTAA